MTWLISLVLLVLLANKGGYSAPLQTPPASQAKPAPTSPSGPTGATGKTDGRGGPTRSAWWQDAKIQKDLGLTTQQVKDIQKVFDAALPNLRREHDELQNMQADLDKLIASGTKDESAIRLRVRVVEAVRSQQNEDRIVMGWRMSQLLTAEQNQKLKVLEQHGRDGRGGGPGPRDQRHP